MKRSRERPKELSTLQIVLGFSLYVGAVVLIMLVGLPFVISLFD